MFRPPSPSAEQTFTISGMDTAASPAELSTRTSGGVRNDDNQMSESDIEVTKVKHVTMPETGQPREQHVAARSGSGSSRSLKLSVPDSEYESDSEVGGGVRCASGVGGRLEEFKWRKPEHSEIRTLLEFPWIQVFPPESVQESRFQALWQDQSWKPLWFSTGSNL